MLLWHLRSSRTLIYWLLLSSSIISLSLLSLVLTTLDAKSFDLERKLGRLAPSIHCGLVSTIDAFS